MTTELLRYAAFTLDPAGGNPAGIWLGAALPPAVEMQRIAAEVGYSETAFLAPIGGGTPGAYRIRYFSPVAEVPFCGHATVATGVVLAERAASPDAAFRLVTNDGEVAVETGTGPDGAFRATLTTVPASARQAPDGLVDAVLDALGWHAHELDPALPPGIGFAGAHHLILGAGSYDRLAILDYAFDPLRTTMLEAGLTTIQLVWREAADRFRARNPFPVGGVVEDPATGAAAGALGAYLRWLGVLNPPASFAIVQGVEMGRPSRIDVEVPAGEGGVRVSGTAVPIGA